MFNASFAVGALLNDPRSFWTRRVTQRRLEQSGLFPPRPPQVPTRLWKIAAIVLSAAVMIVGWTYVAGYTNCPTLTPGPSRCPTEFGLLIAFYVLFVTILVLGRLRVIPNSGYSTAKETASGWGEASFPIHPGQDALFGQPPKG